MPSHPNIRNPRTKTSSCTVSLIKRNHADVLVLKSLHRWPELARLLRHTRRLSSPAIIFPLLHSLIVSYGLSLIPLANAWSPSSRSFFMSTTFPKGPQENSFGPSWIAHDDRLLSFFWDFIHGYGRRLVYVLINRCDIVTWRCSVYRAQGKRLHLGREAG